MAKTWTVVYFKKFVSGTLDGLTVECKIGYPTLGPAENAMDCLEELMIEKTVTKDMFGTGSYVIVDVYMERQ